MRVLLLLCCCCLAFTASEQWQRLDDASRLAADNPIAAQDALSALIEDHPDFAAARYNLGCLLLADDAAAAAEHFERAVSAPVPALAARAWHNLARARYASGRLEEALAAAGKAVEHEPDNQAFIKTRDELRRALLIKEDELRRQREAAAKRLRLTDKRLPDAFIDEAYSHQLTAVGGSGEGYRFLADEEAGLPAGLHVSEDGLISGQPEAAAMQPATATIILSDSAQESARGEVQLRIWPAPSLEPEQLPEVIVDLPYEAMVRCQGLPSPTWSVIGLPAGLAFAAEGDHLTISGTTAELGTWQVTVSATHSRQGHADRVASKQYQLVVSDSFAPDTKDMPPATAWAPYRHQLTVRGPSLSYTFGGGDEHLQISPHGEVAGTPAEAGEVELPITINASDGRKREYRLLLPVNPPPVITEQEPIKLIQGRSIDRPLGIKDGTPPYTWAINEGLLPDGLRLDPDGVLRGAAAEPGETTITVGVRDRWQASTQCEITLTIDAPDEQDQQPPPQDQQEQQEQDQQENGDQQQDQQENGEQQQDQQDQQQNGEQQDQADGQPEEQQGDQQEGSQNEAQAQDAEQQARQLERAATRHWLEQLPDEDRQAMHRLLLQQAGQPAQNEEPW